MSSFSILVYLPFGALLLDSSKPWVSRNFSPSILNFACCSSLCLPPSATPSHSETSLIPIAVYHKPFLHSMPFGFCRIDGPHRMQVGMAFLSNKGSKFIDCLSLLDRGASYEFSENLRISLGTWRIFGSKPMSNTCRETIFSDS